MSEAESPAGGSSAGGSPVVGSPVVGSPAARPVASGSDPRAWLLLLAAIALFALWGASVLVGTTLLVAMFLLAPPPGMKLLPAKAPAVLAIYAPFVLIWLALTVGYLRGCEAMGHPVAPQALLQQLGREGLGAAGGWYYALVIVVLAPVAEEIVFRGYLFTALRTVLPQVWTHIVTATLFGLVHGLDHALPIGVLSLLFGYLRAHYRSLLPSVLAHATHNGLTLLLVVTWPELLDLFYNR